MSKPRAFTLVELLVVIAIIALLISILAPSLGSVKRVAKQVICMTNLKTLNQAMITYAAGNKDTLMAYDQGAKPLEQGCPGNTYKSYVAFSDSTIDPTTKLFSDVRGFGVLYLYADLKPWKQFYCPEEHPRDRRNDASQYAEPWGASLPACGGTGFVRIGCMYYPHIKDPDGAGNKPQQYAFGMNMYKLPSDRWLTCDLLDGYTHMSHITGNSCRWNMGYMDSHVSTIESPTAYSFMAKAYAANAEPDYGGSWSEFNNSVYPLFCKSQ